ncbi:hypothetical protein D3C80_1913010 [compost metagenome]
MPVEQVDFLVVRSGLGVLEDQLHQAGLSSCLDTLERCSPVPFVASFPTVKGLFLLADQLGDLAHTVSLPIQVLGMPAVISG